jgi:hypothetical protein
MLQSRKLPFELEYGSSHSAAYVTEAPGLKGNLHCPRPRQHRHPKREAWRYTITTGVGITKAPTSLGTIGCLKKKV